jgi:NitT/TauT family transport system permease protein
VNDNILSPEQIKYVKGKEIEKKKIVIYQILLLVFVLLLWEISGRVGLIDPFIFSSPVRIAKCFAQMLVSGQILYHTGITLLETMISFSLGTLLGIIIAMGLWWNAFIRKILEPYLVVLNSLPKTALAPIIIVWLGNNYKSIIFTALTISLIITILNVLHGFMTVEKDLIKLIQTFSGTKKDILMKVVLPSNISTIISTMKVNIGLSLIGVIIGEFLVARAGLGYLIVYGSQVFKMDWVMMSIIILAVIATLIYKCIAMIEKRKMKP